MPEGRSEVKGLQGEEMRLIEKKPDQLSFSDPTMNLAKESPTKSESDETSLWMNSKSSLYNLLDKVEIDFERDMLSQYMEPAVQPVLSPKMKSPQQLFPPKSPSDHESQNDPFDSPEGICGRTRSRSKRKAINSPKVYSGKRGRTTPPHNVYNSPNMDQKRYLNTSNGTDHSSDFADTSPSPEKNGSILIDVLDHCLDVLNVSEDTSLYKLCRNWVSGIGEKDFIEEENVIRLFTIVLFNHFQDCFRFGSPRT